MKRRTLLQYSLLGSAGFVAENFLGEKLFSHPAFVSSAQAATQYDWVFLYWMPYDNDLDRFTQPIMQMLTQGVKSSNLAVVVQSDSTTANVLTRQTITKGNIQTQQLSTADSSDEKVFADYLNWAKSQFRAKNWAIVCLGHGGKVDQFSPDVRPSLNWKGKAKWMNIETLSSVVSNFNQQVNDQVELFFFQNCNKGTLEANYTFRNAAKYTLSSQLLLGAPNYYYEPLFKDLANNPQIDGGKLAEKIMQYEPLDMYHSYTAVNNAVVEQLPAKINPVIEAILQANLKNINLNALTTYEYMKEEFVDSLEFFTTLVQQSGAIETPLQEFKQFLTSSMIYKVQKNGTLLSPKASHPNFSGLGLFLPRSQAEFLPYKYMNVFQKVKLPQLFQAILPA